MNRNLRLQLILSAVEKVTGPLKRMREGSGKTAAALKASREQLRQLQQTGKDLSSLRQLRVNLRQNEQALKQATSASKTHTTALDAERKRHATLKTALAVTRAEHKQLTKAVVDGKGQGEAFTRQLETARAKLLAQQQAFDKSAKVIANYRDRVRRADDQVKRLTQQKGQMNQRLDQARQKLQSAGISTDRLRQSARKLRADTAALNAAYRTQQTRLEAIAQRQRRIQELNKQHSKQMTHTAMVGAGGFAAMAAGQRAGQGVAQLLLPGVSFGEQMSELQAVARLQKNNPLFVALKQQARELGGTTAFSATEVGAGQTFLARAGFSPQAIRASMGDVLDLALANGTDLARTADISSNISSAFRLNPEIEGNMKRVADVLSATASRANVDLEMLGETMKYLGQAEGLDVSIEQAAAMAGLLGNIGIQGSMAGTTMRAMLNRLSAPRGDAVKAMDALGLNVADSEGNMRAITDLLDDVAWATAKMGNVEQASYLKRIFGEEAGSGMAELVRQQGSGALLSLIKELKNAQGENSDMARVREDNIGGELKNLRSAWEEVGISISEVNEGPLRELIQSLTGITRRVGTWINENPALVQTLSKVVAVIIGLLTVMGGLTFGVITFLGPMLIARFILARLGISILPMLGKALLVVGKAFLWLGRLLLLNPIGLIITAIAAGAYLIWKNWDTLGPKFQALWETITTSLAEFWNGLKTAWNGGFTSMAKWTLSGLLSISKLILDWSPVELFYRSFAAVLRYFGIQLPDRFSQFGTNLLSNFATSTLAGALQFWSSLKTAWDGGFTSMALWTANGLLQVAKVILDWSPVGLFYRGFAEVLRYFDIELPSKFSEFGANLIRGLINGITGTLGALKDTVVNAGESVNAWFKEKLGIRSPSRLFAQHGLDTLRGYQQGIQQGEVHTLKAITGLSKRIAAAGAAVALGGALALPVAADIQFDTRPALSRTSTNQIIQGDTIHIHIHAAPGMNAEDVARQVQRLLDERDRKKAVRIRSALHD